MAPLSLHAAMGCLQLAGDLICAALTTSAGIVHTMSVDGLSFMLQVVAVRHARPWWCLPGPRWPVADPCQLHDDQPALYLCR